MGKNNKKGMALQAHFCVSFCDYRHFFVISQRVKRFVQLGHCYTILALFCLVSGNVSADTRWYQVELIVFSQNSTNTERFDHTAYEIDWPNKVVSLSSSRHSLQSLKLNPVSYTRLKSADMQLHGAYNQITRKANYHPLLYVSWLQSVTGKGLSNAVQIHSSAGPNGDYPLNGYVRIQRGHYLHFIVDLEYSPDLSNVSMDDNDAAVYRLKEKRRIQLNETHYFDHPKFGVIVKLIPVSVGR
jgi:peptidoglycan-binding protein CsiV